MLQTLDPLHSGPTGSFPGSRAKLKIATLTTSASYVVLGKYFVFSTATIVQCCVVVSSSVTIERSHIYCSRRPHGNLRFVVRLGGEAQNVGYKIKGEEDSCRHLLHLVVFPIIDCECLLVKIDPKQIWRLGPDPPCTPPLHVLPLAVSLTSKSLAFNQNGLPSVMYVRLGALAQHWTRNSPRPKIADGSNRDFKLGESLKGMTSFGVPPSTVY